MIVVLLHEGTKEFLLVIFKFLDPIWVKFGIANAHPMSLSSREFR